MKGEVSSRKVDLTVLLQLSVPYFRHKLVVKTESNEFDSHFIILTPSIHVDGRAIENKFTVG
jgi:hypothetical protein